MNLDELAVRVKRSLLIDRALRRSGANHRVRGLPENHAIAARGDDHRVGREAAHFHRAQIHGADAAANLVSVQNGREKFPVLELSDLALGLVAAYLLVEGIEKLLAGRCAGESCAIEEGSAKASEIEQALSRAVERNAHAVEQVDNAGRGVAHPFHGRLVRQEVAAVNGVVEVLPGGIALALQVLCSVDAALRADRVRPFHRDNREQINLATHFGHFDHGSESRQSAAYDNDLWIDCHV